MLKPIRTAPFLQGIEHFNKTSLLTGGDVEQTFKLIVKEVCELLLSDDKTISDKVDAFYEDLVSTQQSTEPNFKKEQQPEDIDDTLFDMIVYAVGQLYKRGHSAKEIQGGMNIVTAFNRRKINTVYKSQYALSGSVTTTDKDGKLLKPQNFVSPNQTLKEYLYEQNQSPLSLDFNPYKPQHKITLTATEPENIKPYTLDNSSMKYYNFLAGKSHVMAIVHSTNTIRVFINSFYSPAYMDIPIEELEKLGLDITNIVVNIVNIILTELGCKTVYTLNADSLSFMLEGEERLNMASYDSLTGKVYFLIKDKALHFNSVTEFIDNKDNLLNILTGNN